MAAMDIVLDTCVLVNLCAACDPQRFVVGTGVVLHIPQAVAAEAVRLHVGSEAASSDPQEVELQQYLDSKTLMACALQGGQETELYVGLARDLDDGEAMALAIAKARGWLLASDDRKARRRAELLGLRVITTPEVMYQWAVATGVTDGMLRRALLNIQNIARFRPSPGFPQHEWWLARTAVDV